MAPEIGKGKPGAASSDIYSLSVLLYQCVTGSLPFTADSPMGMVLEHVNSTPLPPQQLNPAIPEGLAAALLRGLAKEPEARFATAGELASALRVSLDAGAQARSDQRAGRRRWGGQGGISSGSALHAGAPPHHTRSRTARVHRRTPVPSVVVITPPDAPATGDGRSGRGPARQVLGTRSRTARSTPRGEAPGWKMSLAILVVAHGRRARHCALATAWAIWLAIGGGTSLAATSAYQRHGRRGNGRAEETDGCANGAERDRDADARHQRLRSRRPRRRSIAPSACGPIAFGSTRGPLWHRKPRWSHALPSTTAETARGPRGGAPSHGRSGPRWLRSPDRHALNPQESIQWILPLVAPEATGSYTSTWLDAAGRRDALWQPHPAGHLRGRRHAPPRRRRSHRQRPR